MIKPDGILAIVNDFDTETRKIFITHLSSKFHIIYFCSFEESLFFILQEMEELS